MDENSSPEDVSEPDPKTYCKSCQSSWKPTRRDLIKTAVAVAAVGTLIGGLAVGAAHALTADDCALALAQATAQCHFDHPSPNNPWDEMLLDACLAGAAESYAACMLEVAAEEVEEAIEEAAEYISDHIVEIGTVIIIGGIAILVIACAVATDGLCLVPVAAAAGA